MSNLSVTSASLSVAENSLATPIGIAAPNDVNYLSSALTVTVIALPTDGVVLFADDITPVTLGETLTVAQLTGLRFRPVTNGASLTSTFGFTVSDPAGNNASGTATLAIGSSTTPLLTTPTFLTEPQNGTTSPIGIAAPVDIDYAASALTVKLTALPSNGTVEFSNGTAVTVGETLTVAQLTGLVFKPGTGSSQSSIISSLTYSVSDPGGGATIGAVLIDETPDTLPVTVAASLTVAQDALATPIDIQAPTDANYSSSALNVTVTALPTDGSVVLSNGVTPVTLGEGLTVAQLTSLEFVPTPGASSQSSTFGYKVTDPSGSSGTGSAALAIGASGTSLVTTSAALTVDENGGATPIGIQAPSDANYTTSQLSVTVTALPTNGSVLLSSGTAVTAGESLSVAQLTGLLFQPAQDNTGHTSSFGYSVSDPAGKTANGSAALTTGANAVVLENEKPGTPMSQWWVDPGADSTTIQGFTTAISTDVGGAVDFKIDNETGTANYQINIYRLGYYGGDGATLYATINHQATSAVVQPAAIVDPTTGEVDAGNWSVTDAWTVPTNAASGVYVANIVDGSQVFQVPFIVRNDSSNSDIVFQTSDETWQAYNGWGGANLYGGDGPAGPPPGAEFAPGAAFAVSYNRPIVTRDSVGQYAGPQDSLFGAEYSAIYWLEENGYDVSYISGMDTATDGSLLLNHKVFMDDGHDEYWTDSQVANVEAAKNAGVNLAFLSGNEVFWQTQFGPSIDGSGTANRTLESYKDSHFQTLTNPTGNGTGTFEAPTSWGGAGWDSNALTGQLFSVDENGSLGTITIPYDETQLSFWANTSIANTAPGQTASLEPGLLGYEWDSSPDNGFMPYGLVDLSSTTLQTGAVDYQFGDVDGAGTATHNLVEYRDPTSGALVFGAGTVFWSWGLSSQHDASPDGNTTATDPDVQQAMVNLFANMGVQPGTLQSTLVQATQQTDTTPPTSKITNVSSTNVNEGSVVTVTGTATAVGDKVAAVEISTDGGQTWHQTSGQIGATTVNWTYTFQASAPGTYSIETRATSDALYTETPGPGTPYTVTLSSALSLFSPGDTPATLDFIDAQSAELGVKFTSSTVGQVTGIRFYKGPTNTGTHIGDLWTSTGTLLASATFTNETASGWQQVNFATPVTITPGVTYIASYNTTSGEYSDTPGYFDNLFGQSSGVLNAPGGAALNGLYAYGSGSVFPNNSASADDNFWVDVVFNDSGHQPPALSNMAASAAYSAGGTATTLSSGTTVSDPESTTLVSGTVSITSGFAAGDTLAATTTGTSITASYNASTGLLSLSGSDTLTHYQQVLDSVTYSSSNQNPTNFGADPSRTITWLINDGTVNSAPQTTTVNLTGGSTTYSLFSPFAAPDTLIVDDPNAVDLGVKFQASTNGTIVGIRFYKGSENTGVHTADLWTTSGTLLASATFTNETASGWQQVNFSSPVSITAGTTYIASYETTVGEYSADGNYFTNALTNGPLTAPSNSSSGGNGVYAYGSSNPFPNNTYSAANYWVDAVFSPGAALTPPALGNVAASAAYGAGGTATTLSSGTTVSDPESANLVSGTVSITGGFAAGDTLAATTIGTSITASYNAATGVLSLSGSDTLGHYQQLLDSIGYSSSSQDPTNSGADPSRTISWLVNDGTLNSAPQTTTVSVTNLAPALGSVAASAAYSAGGTGTTLSSGTTVSDPESANLVSGTVSIVSGFLTGDTLAATTTGTSITASYNASTGVLSLSGSDTLAHYQQVLDSVSYSSSSQDPTSSGADPSRTISWLVNDGTVSSAPQTTTVNLTGGPTTYSLFSAGATPGTITVNDPNAVDLGVKFQASTNGTIDGIRFYKGSQNTGVHTGDLWTTSGTLLASATFTNETASGWQQVNFSSPVSITAGTTYIASYETTVGEYSADGNYFTNALTNGPLTAPSSSSGGGNGVYAYGSSNPFPNNTFSASNYWVDAVFSPGASQTPPALGNVAASAAYSASGTGTTLSSGTTVSDPESANLVSGTVSIVSGFLTGDTLAATTTGTSITASYNASTGVLSLSGSDTLAHYQQVLDSVSYSSSSQDPTSSGADPSRTISWLVNDGTVSSAPQTTTVNLTGGPTTYSLFSAGATPGTITVNDPNAVDLGVKFQASTNGTIDGIRFYKGSQNTGVHTGDLWTTSGTLLASATFTNETASGWQQVNFSSPVSITAGTTYIASYETTVGEYSADGNYFTNALTNGPLTAPSSSSGGGNGVYAYGSSNPFPNNTFSASNYWVDAVFSPTPPALPSITSVALSGGLWNLSGSAAAGGTVTVFDGATKLGTTTANSSGGWSFPTNENNSAIRDFLATVTDPAGNTSAASAAWFEGTAGNDVFSFASEAALVAPAAIFGNGGSDTIAITAPATLVDADFAHAHNILTLLLTGASAVTLGASAAAAGIANVATGNGATSITDSDTGTLNVDAGALAAANLLTLSGSEEFAVTGLQGNLMATNETGPLNVTTAAASALSIATGGGTDTIAASAMTQGETLTLTGSNATTVTVGGDLAAGAYTGELTVTASGTGPHAITTGTVADSITAAHGADTITAGAGADMINVSGHTLADSFVYQTVADSPNTSSGYDMITGFLAGTGTGAINDTLDVSAILGSTYNVQSLGSISTQVNPDSIAWMYSSSANQTLVYVNATAGALSQTSNQLMEVALTGNIHLAAANLIG